MTSCPYCKSPAEIVTGDVIYPKRPDLADQLFHRCRPCDAYVGSHRAGAHALIGGAKVISDGSLPLGSLANAPLRRARKAAHTAFDVLWQGRGASMGRKAAYAWLAKRMGLSFEAAHIGEFDLEQCRIAVELCEQFKRGELQ
jgi:hypothetical protein